MGKLKKVGSSFNLFHSKKTVTQSKEDTKVTSSSANNLSSEQPQQPLTITTTGEDFVTQWRKSCEEHKATKKKEAKDPEQKKTQYFTIDPNGKNKIPHASDQQFFYMPQPDEAKGSSSPKIPTLGTSTS